MAHGWAKAALCAALTVVGAHAAASTDIVPLTAQCISETAAQYGVHTDVLLAILMVEGGTVGQNSRSNRNGTYDIGPFQINSMHRAAIKQIGIDEQTLRNNGCVNAQVAAWHLTRILTPQIMEQVSDSESYLRAIARYHSATPEFNIIYAGKLRAAFARMYAQDSQ